MPAAQAAGHAHIYYILFHVCPQAASHVCPTSCLPESSQIPQPAGQAGAPFLRIRFPNGDMERLPLPHNDDPALSPRNSGINQRPCQHNKMGALQVYNNGLVLGTLGFMDRRRVAQLQHVKLT